MHTARLPSAARLCRARDYKRVFDQPLRSKDRLLTVLCRSNDLDHPRLGIAVAKKNVRRAVTRNRVKRVVREYFRLHRHLPPNLDLVVLGRPGVGKCSNSEIHRSLERHCQRLTKQCEGR